MDILVKFQDQQLSILITAGDSFPQSEMRILLLWLFQDLDRHEFSPPPFPPPPQNKKIRPEKNVNH